MLRVKRTSGKKKAPKAAPSLCDAERVKGGLFRKINEILYTVPSQEAAALLEQDKGLRYADNYHEGYGRQMQKWPSHPLDKIIPYLQRARSVKVVADIGCGTCRLHRELVGKRVISIDFAPPATQDLPPTRQTAAEYIAQGGFLKASAAALTLLPDSSVDAAVFSLSLMGTDWPTFVAEAVRILKPDGLLCVAEVASRFKQDCVGRFLRQFQKSGLALVSQQHMGTYFSIFYFKLAAKAQFDAASFDSSLLQPCLYKKA